MRPRSATPLLFLFAAAFAPYAAAQCDGRWVFSPEQQAYPTWGVNNSVTSTLIWDPDETGPQPPQMIIGGAFDQVEGGFAPMLRAARWDGYRWVQLGGGLSNSVNSMTLWDPDGPGPLGRQILAIGLFSTADGLPASRAARWDGSAWHALPGATPALSGGIPGSLTVWDPDGPGPQIEQPIAVVSISSGVPRTSYVARHDGTDWVKMGPDFDNTVESVFSWDPDGDGPELPMLLAAGNFTFQGATALNRIARWDGSQWLPYAGGAQNRVLTLGAWNSSSDPSGPSKLVAAGYFTQIGASSTEARYIAVWDGAQWSALGTGLGAGGSIPTPAVSKVASFDPDGSGPITPELIVVGGFTTAGGATARGVAIWNGSSWRELSGGLLRQTSPSQFVTASTVTAGDLTGDNSGDIILTGGSFFSSGGVDGMPSMQSPRVAVSDGDTWRRLFTTLVGPVFTSPAYTATSWDPDGPGPARSRLVLAGDFSAIADTTASGIVSWDGADWYNMGPGIGRVVKGLTQLDPPNDLIAAGTSSASVAYLDGGSWHTFDPNPWGGADIEGVTAWDPDGSGPMPAGPVAAGDRIVRYYNGTSWQQLGAQFPQPIFAVAAVDHDGDGPAPATLYCAGEIFSLQYIASWDGSSWQVVGGGVNGPVNTLKSWDPDGSGPQFPRLIAGGLFTSAGGVTTGAIASWNGTAWQALGSGLSSQVRGLTTWDPDGPGPKPTEVVAMGTFAVSGSSNIARWNGTAWLPMGIGVNGQPYGGGAFELNGPGTAPVELVIGGNFTASGGVNSRYWARWTETGVPWIAHHPQAGDIAAGATATFSITPAPGYDYAGALMYQWRRNGSPISDGPAGASVGGGVVSGSQSATLVISDALPSDAGDYDCIVSNGCGSATSDAAALAITGACPADLTGDGLIDFSDYLEFLNLFDAGDPRVDYNMDGIVDFSDYLEFLNHFDAGC